MSSHTSYSNTTTEDPAVISNTSVQTQTSQTTSNIPPLETSTTDDGPGSSEFILRHISQVSVV